MTWFGVCRHGDLALVGSQVVQHVEGCYYACISGVHKEMGVSLLTSYKFVIYGCVVLGVMANSCTCGVPFS